MDFNIFSDNCFSERESKDNIVNARGHPLLDIFKDSRHIVLNGRTLSDRVGDFTFITTVGTSVIDLVAVPVGCMNIDDDFKVILHEGSNHMPVEVGVRINGGESEEMGNTNVTPRRIFVN